MFRILNIESDSEQCQQEMQLNIRIFSILYFRRIQINSMCIRDFYIIHCKCKLNFFRNRNSPLCFVLLLLEVEFSVIAEICKRKYIRNVGCYQFKCIKTVSNFNVILFRYLHSIEGKYKLKIITCRIIQKMLQSKFQTILLYYTECFRNSFFSRRKRNSFLGDILVGKKLNQSSLAKGYFRSIHICIYQIKSFKTCGRI